MGAIPKRSLFLSVLQQTSILLSVAGQWDSIAGT